jgi:hypothetical protein
LSVEVFTGTTDEKLKLDELAVPELSVDDADSEDAVDDFE